MCTMESLRGGKAFIVPSKQKNVNVQPVLGYIQSGPIITSASVAFLPIYFPSISYLQFLISNGTFPSAQFRLFPSLFSTYVYTIKTADLSGLNLAFGLVTSCCSSMTVVLHSVVQSKGPRASVTPSTSHKVGSGDSKLEMYIH